MTGKSMYILYRAIEAYRNNPDIKIFVEKGRMRDYLLKYIPAENLVSTREEEKMNDIWWEEAEMTCSECGAEMTLHNTEGEYNPPGEWQYYDYWMCHECWHSEDAE